jgi:PAS domain S-box-containing protein
MNKPFRFHLREPGGSKVLVQLRERLLRVMLFNTLVIGTVLFGFALVPFLQKGLYPTILIYSILYVWTILITFVHRLPYRVRATSWLGILFVFGSINLVNSGLNVDSGLFFIMFITMAILLMDLPGGIAAILLSCVTVTIMGFVNVSERFKFPLDLPQSNPLLWIIGEIVLFLMGTLLIYSLTIMVTGLEENLVKATQLAGELDQTNQSLRLSEARYRALVETSPDLVVLLDLKANILMANQAGLALFGYEHPEEVVGKNIKDLFTHEDLLRAEAIVQKVAETGGFKDVTFPAHRKDGSSFLGEFSSALVLDETGKLQAVIGTGRDVTVRDEAEKLLRKAKEALAEKVALTTVQLRQTTNRLEELVKNAPTVIYSYRVSGDRMTISYISENSAIVLGYEASNLIQNGNFWEHVHPEDKIRVFSQSEQVKYSKRIAFDYRFLHKDGTYRWLRDERILQQDTQSNGLEYVGSWSDISARKKTEEILKISEAKYRNLYEGMMDAYVSVAMDGRIVEFNQAYVNMLGYEPEELSNLTYIDLTPERWHAFENEIVEKQVLPKGYSGIYEKEYIRKDGSIIPVELRVALMRDVTGNPSGMWAIIRDISERKNIEQTLHENEARYRELLDNSMQGVIVFQDLRIVYVNEAVTESLGYTQEELNKLTPTEVIRRVHPDDRAMFQGRLKARLEDAPISERYSLRVIHKNGEIRWVEARTVTMKFQGKPALMTTAIDVTDIRRVEAELQESERIQRTILNASDAVVFLVDTNDVLISANDQFMKRMKVSADTIIGTAITKILPEDIVKTRKKFLDQVAKSGKPITFVDSREGIWFENSLYPILDENRKVVRIAVFARDISEQRRVMEALRASEEQYRSLAEASQDFIFTINRDDRIGYVNSFGAKILAQEPQQLIGQPRVRFFPTDSNPQHGENLLRVFTTGEAYSAESSTNFPAGTIWLNTWLVPLKDASGEITSVLGVSRDITERKRTEEALQQARDRLEERVVERTSELLTSQEKLRILTAQTIHAQEEERRVISRELHDEAGQALITLKYSLAAIQSELPKSQSLPRQRLSDSMKIIDQTMVHIRAISQSLRPPVLEIGGIHMSLQEYCHELAGRTQIPISYQGLEIPGLPDEIGISLFRYVQEALTNVLKHTHATEVEIKLQYKEGEISLSVSDNGQGIEETSQSEGLGLMGIRERLILLGGRLEVRSQKGRGAMLVAWVPWVKAARQ